MLVLNKTLFCNTNNICLMWGVYKTYFVHRTVFLSLSQISFVAWSNIFVFILFKKIYRLYNKCYCSRLFVLVLLLQQSLYASNFYFNKNTLVSLPTFCLPFHRLAKWQQRQTPHVTYPKTNSTSAISAAKSVLFHETKVSPCFGKYVLFQRCIVLYGNRSYSCAS